jgi:hypothetical protein
MTRSRLPRVGSVGAALALRGEHDHRCRLLEIPVEQVLREMLTRALCFLEEIDEELLMFLPQMRTAEFPTLLNFIELQTTD